MVEENKFLDNYNKIKEKYDLPSYEELDLNFEIGTPDDKNILRAVRKKMSEKLETYTKLIEEYIQPDSNFSIFYEMKDFTDKSKENMLSIFKKMMIFYRRSIKLNLGLSEKEDADFIKEFFTSWKEIKEFVINTLDNAIESWKKDDAKEIHQAYFG